MPGAKERALGGHAVLAVGYDDLQKRIIVRNSRGAGWGMDGYFTLPYAYVQSRDLADDFWTIRRGEGIQERGFVVLHALQTRNYLKMAIIN